MDTSPRRLGCFKYLVQVAGFAVGLLLDCIHFISADEKTAVWKEPITFLQSEFLSTALI